jgi:molecular chaperone DnaK (HSP70)
VATKLKLKKMKICVGIDLGTSNSALAFTAVPTADDSSAAETQVLEVPQVVAANAVAARTVFPSVTYLPHKDEFAEGLPALPWKEGKTKKKPNAEALRGEFARDHGTLIPDRMVTSAKSWLSNLHVNPRDAVLPWNGDLQAEEKCSPVAVTAGYLAHLKSAFESCDWAREQAAILNDEVELVVTVPASFDEVARNLTLEAAHEAGYPAVSLLEEPQAAFYAWTALADSDWRSQVSVGDVILVCDVGGGTADFSLIAMSDQDGDVGLERISVGEHLLLGGDNMDLALAYTLRARLEAEGKTLDAGQFLSLIHGCRRAKEDMLEDETKEAAAIAIPSRGSRLIGNTIKTELDRKTLSAVVLDGFFPLTEATDLPTETAGAGLQEFGLPYASDPVVSKHLARFLTRSLRNVQDSKDLKALLKDRPEVTEGTYLKPTAVLFNGGVFQSGALRQRVIDLLASWAGKGGEAPRELEGFQPNLAVARGAAVHAQGRASGEGVRIRAGTARSYYVGLESSMPAIPGFTLPLKAVCVVPQGLEEGSEVTMETREFGLVTGREATFRFLSSEVRSGDEPGLVIDDAERELDETASLTVALPVADGMAEGEIVPVKLRALVTDLGGLELWMHHTMSEQKWKLDYALRGSE